MSSPDDLDLSLLAEIPDPLASRAGTKALPLRVPSRPAPSRSAVRNRRAFAVGLSVLWTAMVLIHMGVRSSVAASIALFHIAVPCALGVAAMFFALARGPFGLGPTLRSAVLLAVAAPMLFLGIALVFQAPTTPDDDILRCGIAEGVVGFVSLVIAGIGVARSTVTLSRWRGALIGSAIGLTWAGLWGIHCVDSSRAHVLLAHGLPVLAFAVVGGLVLSRISRAA